MLVRAVSMLINLASNYKKSKKTKREISLGQTKMTIAGLETDLKVKYLRLQMRYCNWAIFGSFEAPVILNYVYLMLSNFKQPVTNYQSHAHLIRVDQVIR